MQKHLSAVKKNQVSLRNNLHNKAYKSLIRTSVKKFVLSLNNDINKSVSYLSIVYSKLDKAVKRKIIHKNKAARKKSLLNKMLKQKLKSIQ